MTLKQTVADPIELQANVLSQANKQVNCREMSERCALDLLPSVESPDASAAGGRTRTY